MSMFDLPALCTQPQQARMVDKHLAQHAQRLFLLCFQKLPKMLHWGMAMRLCVMSSQSERDRIQERH